MTRRKVAWVACSAKDNGHVGDVRHVRVGLLKMLCGASASYPGTWQPNTTKPPRKGCLSLGGKT